MTKKTNTSVKEVEVTDEVENEEELDEIEEVEEEFEEGEETEEEEYEEIGLEERITNIEKKTNANFWMTIAILVISCLTLIISLTNNSNSSEKETSNSGNNQQSETSGGFDTTPFNTIKPADIESLSKNKTIVAWIGFQECDFCQAYAPLLAQVTKEYGITANFIDLSKLTQDELNVVMALTGKGEWKDFAASFKGTPFTLIIKNNKVVGGINGYVEAEKIAEAFDKAGLKK